MPITLTVSSASELRYVHQVFAEIDRDDSGRMSLREMKNYMHRNAPNLLPAATSLFNKADKHHQGRVTFDQLMHVLYPSMFPKELKAMIDVARPFHQERRIKLDPELMQDIIDIFKSAFNPSVLKTCSMQGL